MLSSTETSVTFVRKKILQLPWNLKLVIVFIINDMHDKITWFWLADSSAEFFGKHNAKES